jgi:hypothetical protein
MKRLMMVWIACCVLSASSFGMLLLEDRRLGVPLPYAIAVAFASVLVAAPLALVLLEIMRGRRPIEVRAGAVARAVSRDEASSVLPPRRRAAEGLVLLDWSSFRSVERAA